MQRRDFLKTAAGATGALATLGQFSFMEGLPSVSAQEAIKASAPVALHPEITPLVQLLEKSPRETVIEEVTHRIRHGSASYREILGALLLAGVRNIQPRPIGFKFHAVLMVNSAHLASLASPDSDRWLPILWAIDQFKASQAADVQQGDWTLGPVDESAVPPSHKARQALIDAMENWDEPAADAAIAGMVRTAGAHEIFELLAPYGARDYREIGHKAIYLANSFRALEVIGWHHAEPVLRSVVYAMLDRVGEKANPAKSDLPADRPFRRNRELIARIKPSWLDGKNEGSAFVKEILEGLRAGAAKDVSELFVDLLNRGVSTQTLFNGLFLGAGELLMRAPGIVSMHASTFTNAVHYTWQHIRDEPTRRLILLQNAAFLPHFRGADVSKKGLHIDALEPLATQGTDAEALKEIFAEVGPAHRVEPARKVLHYLRQGGDAKALIQEGRRLIFQKGRDAHDYKFTAAVWEDFHAMPAGIRENHLAASVYHWRGSAESDSDLVKRVRAALNG